MTKEKQGLREFSPRLCGSCCHFIDGQCRRFPPNLVQVMAGGMANPSSFTFPARSKDSPACGEWAQKETGRMKA